MSVIFTFVTMKYFRKKDPPITAPILDSFFPTIHLAIHHLIRQIYLYNEYALDYTAPMMMTINLITFAFDIVDLEIKDKNESDPFTFLQFLHYSFLFLGLLTGISFDDYCKFIDGQYFEGLDLSKSIHGRK